MLTRLRLLANAFGANSCVLCKLNCVDASGICTECAQALPRWFPRCCRHLAETPDADRGALSASDYWFAALRWTPLTRSLIYRYKELGQTELSVGLAHWLAGHLIYCYQRSLLPMPDCIVAMPVTRSRWQARGFHHTGSLAKRLSELLGINYQPGLLRIIKPQSPQKGHDRSQRWRAAKGSQFCRRSLNGQRVAVLDDVISSGATISAAAAALKKAGAKEVHGWAVIYNQGD